MNFYCEANGTPPLRYVWLHNNGVIDERRGNRLTITAGEKTEGEYQCRVENLFGNHSSEVLRIKVGESMSLCVHVDEQYEPPLNFSFLSSLRICHENCLSELHSPNVYRYTSLY